MTSKDIFTSEILLPAPEKAGGCSVSEALALRKSSRDYDKTKQIDRQTLSNLLWAACGLSHGDGLRTNPTAMNSHDIDVYVFTADAVYFYDYTVHGLRGVAAGDHRALLEGIKGHGQEFVMEAPVTLLMVGDTSRYENQSDHNLIFSAMDAAMVSENINLFCAGHGLATVTRGLMDAEAISKALGLPPSAHPLLNNTVGYE